MRTPLLTLGLFLVAATAGLRAQTTLVTSQTLAGWTLTGASSDTLAADPALSLPAGAQLSRSLPAGGVSVNLVSSPVFGPDASDCPVLEVGPAALVFARDETGGRILLIIGAQTPVVLPVSVPIDAQGQTLEPLTVSLSSSGTNVGITTGTQTWTYAAGAPASQGIVLSAGAGDAWDVTTLQVTLVPAQAADNEGNTDGKGANPTDSNSSSKDASGGKPAGFLLTGTSGSNSPTATTSNTSSGPATAAARPLEIFTPPSVREVRAAAARVVGVPNYIP